MKRTTLQKTTALLTAALTAITLTGCGGMKQNGSTLDVSFDNSYSSNEVQASEFNISTIMSLDTNLLLLGYDAEYNPKAGIYQVSENAIQTAEMKYAKNAKDNRYIDVMGAYANASGGFDVLYNDHEMDADWNILKNIYYVESYDANGELVSGKDVTENIGDEASFYNIIADKNGNLFAVASSDDGMQYITVRDKDFKERGIVEMDAQWIDQLFCAANGNVYVSGYSDMGGMLFGQIDPETLTLSEVDVEGMPEYYNGTFSGNSEYDFFIYDYQAIWGVSVENGTCTEVLNWMNSDFTSDYVNAVAALPDGKFLTIMYNGEEEGTTLWKMERRSEEELKQMEVISLAAISGNMNLIDAVCKFNRSNDKLRIVVKDYYDSVETESEDEDTYLLALEAFKKDMTSGKVADIICTDGLNFESYANKGMFVDLYELMEADESFNKDDYFTNFFESFEYKDKLQRMGFAFTVQTLAAKTKYVGEKEGIAPADFMELVKNPPEGMEVFPNMTKDSLLYTVVAMNMDQYVDAANATCNFNTPEFVELLELCGAYPSSDELYDSMDDADWEEFWEKEELAFRNDTALFKEVYLETPTRMHELLEGDFGGEDMTLIGYPMQEETGNGGMFQTDFTLAISSQSKYQKEIWELYKYLLSEECQDNLEWYFPVNKKSYEKQVTETLNNKEEYAQYYYLTNEEFKIGYPTQEEMDRLTGYISGITNSWIYDATVVTVIDEEAQKYFAGDQSAAQAAEMIQSRVGLYISEQS